MEDIQNELYSTRMLVFMEEEPQSNKYRQVVLTKEEFLNITKGIGTVIKEEGNIETVEVRKSEEIYTLPDLREIYYLPPDNTK